MMRFPIYGKIKNGNQTTNQMGNQRRCCSDITSSDGQGPIFATVCYSIQPVQLYNHLPTGRFTEVLHTDMTQQPLAMTLNFAAGTPTMPCFRSGVASEQKTVEETQNHPGMPW